MTGAVIVVALLAVGFVAATVLCRRSVRQAHAALDALERRLGGAL